jgi:hypothetical protein
MRHDINGDFSQPAPFRYAGERSGAMPRCGELTSHTKCAKVLPYTQR